MALMYYTYTHVRPDTGVIFYVGKGKKKRAYSKAGRSKYWRFVVAKNNGDFCVRILNWFNNEKDALHAETWYISQLKPLGHLVNLTNGGEGISGCYRPDMMGENSVMHRPEVKKKFLGDNNPMRKPGVAEKAAESNRGKKRSPEVCKKFQGENNGMYGRPNSEKQKQAVSKAHKDRPKSYMQRSKTSTKVSGPKNGMYGCFGALNPMYGKVSAMKGRRNPMAAFANYIRHIPYWGA